MYCVWQVVKTPTIILNNPYNSTVTSKFPVVHTNLKRLIIEDKLNSTSRLQKKKDQIKVAVQPARRPWFDSRPVRMGFSGGHSDTGICFTPSTSAFPSILWFHHCSYPFIHIAPTIRSEQLTGLKENEQLIQRLWQGDSDFAGSVKRCCNAEASLPFLYVWPHTGVRYWCAIITHSLHAIVISFQQPTLCGKESLSLR